VGRRLEARRTQGPPATNRRAGHPAVGSDRGTGSLWLAGVAHDLVVVGSGVGVA
jgi:hypothetical protein